MKYLYTMISILIMSLILPIVSQAGPLKRTHHNQLKRVKQGVKSGQLTRKEGRQLVREQRQLRRQERRMMKDGLTKREKARMTKNRAQASSHIYKEKHDSHERPINHREAHKIRKMIKRAKTNDGNIDKKEAKFIRKSIKRAQQN